MEVSYRRAFEKSYLQLKQTRARGDSYEIRMMQENPVRGLLSPTVESSARGPVFSYDISFLTALNVVYEKRRMGAEELRELFKDLLGVLTLCRVYLLEPGDLLLAPEFIFTDREKGGWSFCLLPGGGREEESGSGGLLLAEYLLRRIDHSDEAAVRAGYEFFSRVSSENSTLAASLREAERLLDPEPPAEEEAEPAPENEVKERVKTTERRYGEAPPKKQRLPRPAAGARERKTAGFGRILGLMLLCTVSAAGFILALLLGDPDPVQVGCLSFLVVVVVSVCSRSLLAGPDTDPRPEAAAVSAAVISQSAGPPCGSSAPRSEAGLRNPERRAAPPPAPPAGALRTEPETENYTRLLYMPESGADEMRCRLVSLGHAEDIEIDAETILVGAGSKADHILPGRAVSRLHARIRYAGGEVLLTDLNSLNGTFVNGERLPANREMKLTNGDRVTFADAEYQLSRGPRETAGTGKGEVGYWTDAGE